MAIEIPGISERKSDEAAADAKSRLPSREDPGTDGNLGWSGPSLEECGGEADSWGCTDWSAGDEEDPGWDNRSYSERNGCDDDGWGELVSEGGHHLKGSTQAEKHDCWKASQGADGSTCNIEVPSGVVLEEGDSEGGNAGKPGQTTEVMELPQGTSGFIIGAKGARIRELMAHSGASLGVKVQQTGIECVHIAGSREAVSSAKKLIADTLDAFALSQDGSKGDTNGMDAIKNPSGKPITDLGVGDEVTGTVTAIVPCLGVWFDVGAVKWGMLPWRFLDGNNYQHGQVVAGLCIKAVDHSLGRFSLMTRGPAGDDEAAFIKIPHGFTELVLGERGSRIEEISKQSGARVFVEQISGKDFVHIGGAQQAVAIAKALVSVLLDGAMSAASLERPRKGTGMRQGKGKGAWPPGAESSSQAVTGQSTTKPWSVPGGSLKIPKIALPQLFGKGGATITRIRVQSGATRISIQESVEDSVALIYGSPESVEAAKALVAENLEEFFKNDPGPKGKAKGKGVLSPHPVPATSDPSGTHPEDPDSQEPSFSEEVELPAGATRLIIGMHGRRIMDMQSRSGATLSIDDSRDPHVVWVSGTKAAIEKAKALLVGYIDNSMEEKHCGETYRVWKSTPKIRSSNLPARESPPDAVMKFPMGFASRFIGKNRTRLRSLMEQSGAYISLDTSTAPACVRIYGNEEAAAKAKALISEVIEQIVASDESFKRGKGQGRGEDQYEPESAGNEPIELSPDDVPRLIGKAGMVIKDIQSQSGAEIRIETDTVPPLAWFSGTSECVACAKALVAEIISGSHTSEGPRGKGSSRQKGRGGDKGGGRPYFTQIEVLNSRAARERGPRAAASRPETVERSANAGQQIGDERSAFIRNIERRSGVDVFLEESEGSYRVHISGSKEATARAKAGQAASRTELFRAVFEACDADGSGRLILPEMRRFAKFAGWLEAGSGDWARDYEDLCGEVETDPALGISCDALEALVSDATGRSLSDKKLKNMLTALVPPMSAGDGEPQMQSQVDAKKDQRSELIRAVFEAIDKDADGRLSRAEFQSFAELSSRFLGPEGASWEEHYKAFYDLDDADAAALGLGLEQFEDLVNAEANESEGHFSNDQFQMILDWLNSVHQASSLGIETFDGNESLPAVVGAAKAPTSQRHELQEPQVIDPAVDDTHRDLPCDELISAAFNVCDSDADGRLGEKELRTFAELALWFDGDESEWAQEYKKLCRECGADSRLGLDLELLGKLVKDRSAGTVRHCTEKHLRSILRHSEAAGQKQLCTSPLSRSNPAQTNRCEELALLSRSELISKVFEACDMDCDRHLDKLEMRHFAEVALWFGGGDKEWEEEYESLCSEVHADARAGLGLELFTQLVDDESGAYCTEKQFRDMLVELRPASQQSPAPLTPSPSLAESRDDLTLEVDSRDVTEASGTHASALAACDSRGGTSICDSLLPKTRSDLVNAVFSLCDDDADGRLKGQELRRFAELALWFAGSEAEWDEEYESLCSDTGAEADVGLDVAMFAQLVNDESGGYCTDEQLSFVIKDLQEMPSKPAEPSEVDVDSKGARGGLAASQPVVSESMPRAELILAAFYTFDLDNDGRLKQAEMRRFAERTGFEGDDQDWVDAYTMLCAEFDVDPDIGIDESLFASLVNDTSESTGCHCTDKELRSMLPDMVDVAHAAHTTTSGTSVERPPRTPEMQARSELSSRTSFAPDGCHAARDEIIHTLFCNLDVDHDGFLSQEEMRQFAEWTGFEGGDAEWAREYRLLCLDGGQGDTGAVGEDLFARLVNDPSEETGCYCSDKELRAMLTMLAAQHQPMKRSAATGEAGDKEATLSGTLSGANQVSEESAAGRHCNLSGSVAAQHQPMKSSAATGQEGDKKTTLSGTLSEAKQASEDSAAGREGNLSAIDSDGQGKDVSEHICSKSGRDLADLGVAHSDNDRSSLLQTNDASTTAEFQPTVEVAPSQSRADLIRSVFNALDLDGDGRLQDHEVRRLVEHSGCFCSDRYWLRLYSRWCVQHGRDGSVPADLALLEALVNDESEDDGHFCSDEELRSFLASAAPAAAGAGEPAASRGAARAAEEATSVGESAASCGAAKAAEEATSVGESAASCGAAKAAEEVVAKPLDLDPSSMSRSELVREVFALLDTDGDKRLNQVEMQLFAQMTGFRGTDEDWAFAYGLLCRENGGDPRAGVDAVLLAKLLDDESEESGCYCSTNQLCEMLQELRHSGSQHQHARPAHR